MPDKVDQLYDALKADGAVKNSRENFRGFMFAPGKQGYNNRLQLYKSLRADGAIKSKSYEEFRDKLGIGAVNPQRKQQASAAIGGTASQATQPVQNNMANWANPVDATDMRSEWEKQQKPKEQKPNIATETQKAVRGEGEGAKRLRAATQQLKDRADYQKETGKELKSPVDLTSVGVTPTLARDEQGAVMKDASGNPLIGYETDSTKANVQRQEDEKKRLKEQLEEAYAEREKLDAEIEEGRASAANRLLGGMLPGNQVKSDYNDADMEQSSLLSAKRLLDRRITALEAANNSSGFWGGTKDQLKDPTSWSFGLSDAEDALVMANLKKKLDAAGGDTSKLTEGERLLADNYLKNQEAQKLNEDRDWWYGAGQGFGQSLSFMKDFALSGGGFANIAKAGMRYGAKKGAQLASKTLGNYMTKNLGTKALGKTIETIGKGAGLVAGTEAGGLLLNNTVQAASSAADIINKNTGNLTYDKDGNLTFEGGQSLGKAILTSQLSRTGENASELFGIAFDAVPGILGKVIQRTTPGKVLKNIANNKVWKAGEKGLGYLGVQSVWGEGMEEEYGMLRTEILNTLTNGEYEPNGSGILDINRQLNTWANVGLTSMLLRVPAMIASGTNTANYYANKYNLNSSDKNMRSTFGNDERYNVVKTAIDEADNNQLAGVLSNLMTKSDLTNEEKQAMFTYANDLVKMRGFNIGNVVAAANGYKEPPRVSNYNINGLHVDEVDKDGNVINSYDYDNADDLKTGLYEMQQNRADQTLQSDLMVMKARPNDQYQAFVDSYCEQFGIEPQELEEMLAKPSMERTEAEQSIVAPFADSLHNVVYDNSVLHEEQSQQDGEDLADVLSLDLSNLNEEQALEAQKLTDEYKEAENALQELYKSDENIKDEIESMAGQPAQSIVSSLETFSPKAVDTVIGYYNAKAKLDGFVNRMSQKIDEEAANRRERHTFTGTINGQEDKTNIVNISDGTNTYTLVSGNVTTDGDGRITGSDTGLIIALDENGDFVQLSDSSGYGIVPSGMTLDQYQAQQAEELQLQMTSAIDPEGKLIPEEVTTSSLQENDLELWPDVKKWLDENPDAKVTQLQREFGIGFNRANRYLEEWRKGASEEVQGGTNADVEAGGENTGADEASAAAPSGTALERIPKDEQGNPIYEQGTPEDTYDALTEQVGESAQILIKNQLDAAKKRYEKLVKDKEAGKLKGKTLQEQIAEIKELQDEIDAEDALVKFWTKVMTVPNNRRADEEANVQPAVEETPQTGETVNETNEESAPDWSVDKASDARARGYRMENGYRVDRQQPITEKVEGNDTEVKFDKAEEPVKGKITVAEGGTLIPSHVNGQRNVMFFIDEAQPKERTDVDSEASSNRIAEKVNPEEITGGVTAYTGSPVVNTRGEVIQGNNRAIGMQKMWGNAAYEESQRKYKQYLIDHAEEFGLDPKQIEKMNNPVMVRMVDVSDDEAIRLGQKTAANTESGGKERIDPQRVIQQMGDNFRVFTNQLFSGEIEDQTLLSIIAENGVKVLKWLNDGTNHPKYITDTQFQSCFDNKGNLTEEAKTDLRRIVENMLFVDAPERLADMFYKMPAKAQNAILSTIWRDSQSEKNDRIIKDIQSSIEAFTVINGASEEFRGAKDVNTARAAVKDLQKQTQMFGDTETVLEKFSNFALELAIRYKGDKQNSIRAYFNNYYDAVQGKGGSLFESAAKKAKEQAIKDIFDIDINENENGTEGSNTVESDTGNGTEREPVGEGEPAVGEPVEEGEQPAVSGGGTETNEEVTQSREDYLASHPLTEEQIMADTESNEDEKLNAIDFLRGEDNSAISRFYYDQIYNRATLQPTTNPMEAIEKAAKSFREEQKSQDQQDIDDALNEFNNFLDSAKGSNVLDKFMRKGIEGNDKAQASLLDAFTLTNDAQRMFLKDLLRLASKVGYAYIKSGVHDAQAWSKKMSDSIGRKLKEVLGWDDAIVGEFVDEVWNQKYTVDGQRMRLSEHAERLKNHKGADTTVNDNKQENNEAEKVVSSQQKAAKPQLEGDSAEFAERQEKVAKLREDIGRKLRQAVLTDDNQIKTMQSVKALATKYGLDDISMTDLQELVEAEIVDLARTVAQSEEWSEQQKFDYIVKLYNSQPSLNARDNDRINKQQYSTPAPMAYLMGLFTSKGKKVESGLEPSAGNGMLTIGLPKEKMHVNDIDEMRLSNLQKQGFGEVTSQDGLLSFGEKQYDVIVTNPPFGNVTPKTYDGLYEISGLEHQMAINALESMKDDGRAAIIIGGNTEYNQNGSIKGKDRVFLNYLYAHYNVVDVINMDGKTLYSRQGTGFPVRMILINGRKEFNAKDFAPVQSKARAERVNSYDELLKRVNDDILSNENKPAGVHDTESGESGRVDDISNAGTSTQTGVRDVRTEGGEGQPSVRPSVGRSVQRSGSTTNGTDTGVQSAVDSRPSGVESRPSAAQSSGSTVTQTEAQRDLFDGRDNTERPVAEPVESSGGRRSSRVEDTHRVLGEEKVPYIPQSKNPYSLQSQMPAEQADVVKKALEKLGDVDTFLVNELGYSSVEDMWHGSQSPENHGGLAADQVDSVAMAIHQMNQGNAFIIGDQTGIGKGRQAAALIRYGVKKGGCPVFITVKKALFSDMYRDLCDIGSPDLKPFIWSADDTQHSGAVTDKDGNVIYEMPSKKEQERVVEYINKNGKLPPEYDYVLTTYDSFKSGTMVYENGTKAPRQFPKGKKPSAIHYNGQAKRDALETLASSSYVIMDESHNAGGEGSNVSGYLQYITSRAKGITFLSATFAKRPGNMPIYSLKTAISKAGVDIDELIDAVKRGGATFQEIMSKALTEAGQMIRRERDMTGVTIDWKGIDDEAVVQKQREQYDQVIGLFNDIINFQRTYVDPMIDRMNDAAADIQGEVNHTPGTRDMGINNTPFASRTYNIVQQVLLSLKAEEAAKRAIEHLKAEHKPVITVANTNEGAADEVAAAGSEAIEMPDLSVNLKKGLRGTLRFTEKDSFGNTVNREIPFDSLSPEGQARYREIMDAIDKASTGLSLSPIDVIKNELKKAGYKVGELTGRQSEFVYNEDGTVNRVKRTGTDKKKTASDFNNGRLDALILNKSAGTGISLHASTKFDDQHQRVMIVAQAQGDVNDEVQIRGRIDRTGQVLRGMYEYIVSQIPSEQRLLMMLKAKLRSLDANTTSSQKSKFNEMDVQDIINKYGDDIVIQYLAEHTDLADKMCNPLKWKGDWQVMSSEQLVADAEKSGESGQTASKVLGRMALLTVREQEKMLNEIGELYQAEIDRLNEMGENDLEITEMPLKAKTIEKEVWEQGIEPGGNNPFADNSYVEKVQMDVLKKPMKAEEVKRSQARLLGGKTWKEYKKDILEKVDEWAENKKKETTETITARAEKKAKAEQERYVKGAKKSQEKNGMTDEEIEKNGQFQYNTIYQQEIDKLNDALAGIEKQKQVFVDALDLFNTDNVYAIPSNIYDLGGMTFEPGMGKLIDIKISDNYSTTASTLSFATLDGRRKITVPVSGMVKQQNDEKRSVFPAIMSLTAQAKNGMFGSNVSNTMKVLAQDIDNWDRLTSSAARKEGYIITGNLLKALVSTREQKVGGKLISYTTDTGEVRQGILMPDNFNPSGLTSKTPISSMKDELRYSRDSVVSADGDVTVRVGSWDWATRGFNTLELIVPKSKKKGEKYFNDKTLLKLMNGQFEGSSKMKAEFKRENLDAVMSRLDELGVTVQSNKEDSQDNATRQRIDTANPLEAINRAADSWRRSVKESESSLSSTQQLDDSKNKSVPLERRTTKSYTDKDGNYHRGIEEEISDLEADISRTGTADAQTGKEDARSETSTRSNRRLEERLKQLRAEVDRRERKKRDIKNEYNIDDKGNVSIGDLSRLFHDLNSNKAIGKLFEKVYSTLKELGVDFRFSTNLDALTGGESYAFHNVTFYNWDILLRDISDQRKAVIILHEMIHNLTSHILERYDDPSLGELSEKQKDIAKELLSIYNALKEAQPKDKDGKEPYGMNNAHEMIAELANPAFREILSKIPYKNTNESILQKIKNAIRKLLGIGNALGALGDTLDKILDTYDTNGIEEYREQRAELEQELRDSGSNVDFVDFVDAVNHNTGRKIQEDNPLEAIRIAANRFRRERNMEPDENPAAHSAKAVYEDRLNRVETMFSEAYQDSMISLKAGQNAIAKDKDIPDSQNAYMAENLMHGKNKNEQDLFNLMFRDPLINTINRIMDLTGMNWGDVDRYVYTKSGLERNREFYVRDWLEANKDKDGVNDIRDKWLALKEKAEDIDENYTFADYLEELTDFIKKNINAKYDPSKHDYSGFRAMFGEDYDESEIIDDLMNTETEIGDDVNTLWEQINACTKYGLDRYKEAGLKSEEQIENVKKMFHWYVPMRGFKEDTGEDMYQYFTGKGRTKNYVGGLLKHAKGRGSEASYPISTIFAMTYKAIADCNQNLVNQKFYRLCQANKNDLVVLSDSWVKLNETTGEWEEVWPQITDDMSEEEIRQATIDFEKEMNGLADVDKAKKIKGKPNFTYKPIDKDKKNEHIVEVWMNGQKKLATVVGNPRMAQALNGQLRFERGHNIFSKWNADIKNFMSSLFTSYSPTFALRNMLRDWTHFRTMLIVREGEGYAHAAGKYYAQQMPKMMSLFKKYREGALGDSEMERDFKDFMDNGGITGFVQMNKIDEIQKEMEKLHKQMKDGKVIKLNNKVWDYTLGAVEAVNEAIENNARFATYRASRHYANRTKSRSAYDAKEITVNFNRKGAGSKTAGFKGSSRVEHAAQLAGITSQILGEGRIFFNATIQAIATTFKNFQNPDGSLNKPYIAKWAARYAAPPFLFGLALPFINQMLAAAFGGDDDDPYANLPEWTRRKNLCIYIGNNNFITIPVGQELAAFLSLGDMFAGYTYAPNLKPVDRSFTEDMAGIMNTFSPIDVDTKITKGGITRDPMSEITGRTFSVLAPLVAVEQNLSWTGRPIYREDVFKNDYLKPEYQMVYSGTNPVLVGASKILHELSGGDDAKRGKLEVNPAIVQYLWEQYTGGPGKVFSNTISIGKDVKDLAGEVVSGKPIDTDFNIRKVEGLKAFVQQGDDRTEYYRVKAKYRKYKEDADKLYNDIKGYKSLASEDPTAKMKLDRLMKGEEYTRMKIAREAEKHLAKIRKSADALEGAEKKKRMKEYNKLVKEVVDRLDDVQ